MTDDAPLILRFAEIRADQISLVGGKGANLGEMVAAGLPVPPGFCLTTAAFQRFMAASRETDGLYRSLEGIAIDDLDAVRRIGAQVRQTLLKVPLPPEVADAALAAWRQTGSEHAYAVRSSATAEDLPQASFAGQQDTFLNVIGAGALLEAVRRCWISLFTDRAILYRMQNGFSNRDVALGVVVQRMVMAERSGILFTADPVTGHRQTLVINASIGLGEALVGGLVTPDRYRVDKRTQAILERQIADKEIAVYPQQSGGTRTVDLPPERRGAPALSDGQIAALAELGMRIEAHYGTPQDIEWAIDGADGAPGEIYILQSRPITSLYPIDGLKSPDGTLHVYFSMGHQQSMTRAMAPLSISSLQMLLPIGHHEDRFGNAYVRSSGGRIYVDLTLLLRHPIARRFVLALLGELDALAPETVRLVMQRPEFWASGRGKRLHLTWPAFKLLLRILGRVQRALWLRDLSDFLARTNALMDGFIADARRRLQAAPKGQGQVQALLDILPQLFPFIMNWVPEAFAGVAATRLLARLARRWLPPDACEALTLGIPGNVINEMNLALDDLAERARGCPELAAWFDSLGEDAGPWLEGAARIPCSEPFLDAWRAFLGRYGSRGPAEIDIMMPRWGEDPLPLLQVIAGALGQPDGYRARFQAFALGRERAYQELIRRARRGPLGWPRVRLFRRLYHVMTQVGGMREHHKFLAVRLLGLAKETLKEVAAMLVTEGRLKKPDDMWFLTWRELLAIRDDDETDWSALIQRRRADYERFQRLRPPLIITSDGETPAVQYHVEDAPPGALLGNPVSPGVVEGTAHVVRDPQREQLAPGEILVAEFTDPGWTPLFINAAGLVLEVGGALTHGAVVAREYGIPAVVGVRHATQEIHTGQRLRVDGNRGVVEVL